MDNPKKRNSFKEITPERDQEERYPEKILESQGDLADRAEIEIEQKIKAGIIRARQELADAQSAENEAQTE